MEKSDEIKWDELLNTTKQQKFGGWRQYKSIKTFLRSMKGKILSKV